MYHHDLDMMRNTHLHPNADVPVGSGTEHVVW